MDTISTTLSAIFGTPIGIAGFLCGVALLFLVAWRTMKKRGKV
jgi:hypothetical protein